MKRGIFILMTVLAAACGKEIELPWLTSLPEAETKAKAENKLILMDFTGSDWCEPCEILHKTVLTQLPFADYAKSNLVLVVVDDPMKDKRTPELKKADDKLREVYKVEGQPTLIATDQNGKELWRHLGLFHEGGKELVESLEKLKK